MFVSFFILGISLTLFVYWFRYTCLLILSAKTTKDYASEVARANQLSFLETRDRLTRDAKPAVLDGLYDSLDRDYTLLTYLLRNAASLYGSGRSVETMILMIDFRMMTIWYAMARRVSDSRARAALLEMSSIVHHLANAMGEKLSSVAAS